MFLSIFVPVQNHSLKLIKTLNSLKNQTSDNYELILIDDIGLHPQIDSLEFLEEVMDDFETSNIKVLTSLYNLGFSNEMNCAIDCAEGKYFMFLEEGEILNINAIEKLEEAFKAHCQENNLSHIDMAEYNIHYLDCDCNTKPVLWNKTNSTYNPQLEKEVFALVNPMLISKIFSKEYVVKKNLVFAGSSRNDALFIYKALTYADCFLVIPRTIVHSSSRIFKFSIFVLINQWAHVFNWYRDANLYKDYENELEYAFMRFCLINFLHIVKVQNNKKLEQKAIRTVEHKVFRRIKRFKYNMYLNKLDDREFRLIAKDIKGYLQSIKEENDEAR